MARIRSIKPEFWDDEKMCALPRDVRLLYIGMWTFSDDFGVIKSSPIWLKSKIFPYDEIQLSQFKKWLEMLERPGFSSPGGSVAWALKFQANGEAFYYLPNFSRHQKVDHPSTLNRNPEVPKDILDTLATPRETVATPRSVLDGKGEDSSGEGAPRFKPPTIDQIREYCKTRSNAVNPEKFESYYQANGWKVGRNSMKDWKAAVRTWETNGQRHAPKGGASSSLQPDFI